MQAQVQKVYNHTLKKMQYRSVHGDRKIRNTYEAALRDEYIGLGIIKPATIEDTERIRKQRGYVQKGRK